MAKLRLLFTKEAQASYISHLDTMRTFQRVFPRAELHLKHSNGFHPHPIISIVLPLPVGQSSDCELLDFETLEETDGAGIAEKLNTGLPAGLRVRECYPATRPVREFAFLRARLELIYDNGVPDGAIDALRALFARPSLMIEKRTKHKDLAQIDVVPLLREITLTQQEGSIFADAVVAAQNPGLNPAYLAQAIERELSELKPDFVRVRRVEIYDAEMNIFR